MAEKQGPAGTPPISPSDPSAPKKAEKFNWYEFFKSLVSSAILLSVYLVILFIVFLSLSAHEMQTRISSTTIDGRPANMYDVLRNTPEIRKARNKLLVLEETRSVVGGKIRALNVERILAKNLRDVPAIEAWQYFHTLGIDPSDEIRQNPPLGMPEFSSKRGLMSNDNPSVLLFTPKMEKLLKTYEKLHGEVIRINRQKDRQNERRVELDTIIAKKRLELSQLIGDSLPHVRTELNFFEVDQTPGWTAKALNCIGMVTVIKGEDTAVPEGINDAAVITQSRKFMLIGLPPVMLMILIAIVGGALGGLIRVTETYLSGSREENERVHFYVARPLFGMITALTVFVLLKSGVLLVSGAAPGGAASSSLNAYFVAFASIVAGLMSENAVDTLRSAGKGLLSKNTITGASYASGVAGIMSEENKTMKDLYQYFTEPKEVVDGWLTEQVRVPAHARQIISAWLEKSPRTLFTDIRSDVTVDIEKLR